MLLVTVMILGLVPVIAARTGVRCRHERHAYRLDQ